MTRLHRPVLFTLLAAAAALLPASPAAAIPPERTPFHEETTIEIDCGTFVLVEDIVVDGAATVFFDRDGSPVRTQLHVRYEGLITNPEGETFRDPGRYTSVRDLEEGTTTIVGLVFNITVPGEGSVAQDTGRVVFDEDGNVVFQAGKFEVLQGGDAVLCGALG